MVEVDKKFGDCEPVFLDEQAADIEVAIAMKIELGTEAEAETEVELGKVIVFVPEAGIVAEPKAQHNY